MSTLTTKARRFEHVVSAARARVRRAVELNDAHGWVSSGRPSPEAAEDLARRIAHHILETLDAYRVHAEKRLAAAKRLVDQWSIFHGPADEDQGLLFVETVEDHAITAGVIPDERIQWPSNVSLDDARQMIARSRDPHAQAFARSMQHKLWTVPKTNQFKFSRTPPREMPGSYRTVMFRHHRGAVIDADVFCPPHGRETESVLMYDDPTLHEALVRGSPFHPSTAAIVAWAEKIIADDQRKARPFTVPSRKEPRAAIEGLLRPPDTAHTVEVVSVGVRLTWTDEDRPRQLAFSFLLRDIGAAVVCGIQKELGPEGLRDLVTLFRMAHEHGRSGRFRWTWAEHRRDTARSARVQASRSTDEEEHEATIARLRRLSQAELHVEEEQGEKRVWRAVGEGPLLRIVGGRDDRRSGRVEGLELKLNPVLYEGARARSKSAHYTLIPNDVLELPERPLCLAVMLAFQWRYAVDEGGTVVLHFDTLYRLMGDDKARLSKHRNAGRADRTLHKALDAVVRAMGDGCRWAPVEGGKIRVTPPQWWSDHVVHGAPLALPVTDHPVTGSELVTWRKAHDLSQRRAAAILGVGVETVKRAEEQGPTALPRAFARAAWHAAPSLALVDPT